MLLNFCHSRSLCAMPTKSISATTTVTASQPHSLTASQLHSLAASQPRSLAASQLPPSSVAAVVVGSRSSRRGSVGGSGSGGGLSAKSPVGVELSGAKKDNCLTEFDKEFVFQIAAVIFPFSSLRSPLPPSPPTLHPDPPFKILEMPCRLALPGPRWLAIPLFNNNIIRSRCGNKKLANCVGRLAKSAGSGAGSGGFRVRCWNQKMLVAAAVLHFRRGFRRGFRRVPLGSGHANVQMG